MHVQTLDSRSKLGNLRIETPSKIKLCNPQYTNPSKIKKILASSLHQKKIAKASGFYVFEVADFEFDVIF